MHDDDSVYEDGLRDDSLRDRMARQGEETLGRLAQELLDSPLVAKGLTAAFEARERAARAQEVAMAALNLPSAGDLERLTRRVRSVSQRLEGIEDGLDRLDDRLGRTDQVAALEDRLTRIEQSLARLEAEAGGSPAPVPAAKRSTARRPAPKRSSAQPAPKPSTAAPKRASGRSAS